MFDNLPFLPFTLSPLADFTKRNFILLRQETLTYQEAAHELDSTFETKVFLNTYKVKIYSGKGGNKYEQSMSQTAVFAWTNAECLRVTCWNRNMRSTTLLKLMEFNAACLTLHATARNTLTLYIYKPCYKMFTLSLYLFPIHDNLSIQILFLSNVSALTGLGHPGCC